MYRRSPPSCSIDPVPPTLLLKLLLQSLIIPLLDSKHRAFSLHAGAEEPQEQGCFGHCVGEEFGASLFIDTVQPSLKGSPSWSRKTGWLQSSAADVSPKDTLHAAVSWIESCMQPVMQPCRLQRSAFLAGRAKRANLSKFSKGSLPLSKPCHALEAMRPDDLRNKATCHDYDSRLGGVHLLLASQNQCGDTSALKRLLTALDIKLSTIRLQTGQALAGTGQA